jgi:hypothetical protein
MAGAITFLVFDLVLQVRKGVTANYFRAKAPAAGAVLFLIAIFVVGFLYVSSITPHKEPASQPQPTSDKQLVSRATKFIFACDIPPDPNVTDAKRAEQRKEFERAAKAWGDTIGFSILLSDIEGGTDLQSKQKHWRRKPGL